MALEKARGGKMIGGLGPTEIIVICIVFILLFGSRIFVSWAKGLGETISFTKKSIDEIKKEVD